MTLTSTALHGRKRRQVGGITRSVSRFWWNDSLGICVAAYLVFARLGDGIEGRGGCSVRGLSRSLPNSESSAPPHCGGPLRSLPTCASALPHPSSQAHAHPSEAKSPCFANTQCWVLTWSLCDCLLSPRYSDRQTNQTQQGFA